MIFEHVGITVSDLEKSINFYKKIFGFSLLRKTKTNAYLYLENELLELMQSENPIKIEHPQSPEGWMKYMWGPVGLIHLGFRVDDLDEAVAKLERLGGSLITPPTKLVPKIEYVTETTDDKLNRAAKPIKNKYWKIAMFADPDGVILEILER